MARHKLGIWKHPNGSTYIGKKRITRPTISADEMTRAANIEVRRKFIHHLIFTTTEGVLVVRL